MKTKVKNFEENAWADYRVNHPSIHMAQVCLKNVTSFQCWCLADNYPDLVSRMHILDQAYKLHWTQLRCTLERWHKRFPLVNLKTGYRRCN